MRVISAYLLVRYLAVSCSEAWYGFVQVDVCCRLYWEATSPQTPMTSRPSWTQVWLEHKRQHANSSLRLAKQVSACAVSIEADSERVDKLLSELEGKSIEEVISAGVSKLANVPSGGGGGGGAAASGGGGGGAAGQCCRLHSLHVCTACVCTLVCSCNIRTSCFSQKQFPPMRTQLGDMCGGVFSMWNAVCDANYIF